MIYEGLLDAGSPIKRQNGAKWISMDQLGTKGEPTAAKMEPEAPKLVVEKVRQKAINTNNKKMGRTKLLHEFQP